MKESSSRINFKRALLVLEKSLSSPITEPRDLSGIIKDFELAYELSWKVLKKLLLENGHETLGAKDVYSKAYQLGYLKEEQPWLSMIQDRNRSTHVYDEKSAREIVDKIKSTYMAALKEIESKI